MSSLDDGTKVMPSSIGDVDVTVTFLYADAETLTVVESNCTPATTAIGEQMWWSAQSQSTNSNEESDETNTKDDAPFIDRLTFSRVRQLQHNEEAVSTISDGVLLSLVVQRVKIIN
ncbi:hypothetical protein BLNAU_24919 [Blattamonas nauphoetae]|uniref:Uncharacterized protein n=1 Tax=Blattamonas nauphoetae TaxID=2049346 RepID=A0ABQ9WL38_9EUKA|nr:hypothetical protein BLNAU_24919 [Blattamonas nauphoetae]